MTTITSNHGARLQRDQRLQPKPKPRLRSKVTIASGHHSVDLEERIATSPKTPNGQTKNLTNKHRPSVQVRSRIDNPVKSSPRLKPAGVNKTSAKRVASAKSAPAEVGLKRKAYEMLATPLAYLAGSSALLLGWLYRDTRSLSAESGLGYLLGIVAVFCMVTLLVYPVRKRFRFLRFIGSVKNWFRTHMILGALGPLAALYHCNFQLGSLNSQVALYSALLVAGSGLVGRVLYQKMNQNLYGSKTNFNQLRKSLQENTPQLSDSLTFLPLLAARIGLFDQRVFAAGKRLWPSIKILPGLGIKARREKKVLLAFSNQQLTKKSRTCPVIRMHQHRLTAVLDRYLYLHMAQARRLARLQLYERLFALWHVVHLPFFFMLVISTAVHVLAVHLY